LLEKHLTEVLVEVGGLAYEIHVPVSTLVRLPETGQGVILHTHFVVREDAQLLYGFFDHKEKALFRALIKVNGVGPKMALAILSGMAVDEFVRTVNNNDVSALVKMPGVGRKTAERLVVEMRDRLADFGGVPALAGAGSPGGAANTLAWEAESALVSLGYKPQEAGRAVSRVLKDNEDVADAQTLIRLALKSMA
jgi:Holliday junction DNA helicase RuvA